MTEKEIKAQLAVGAFKKFWVTLEIVPFLWKEAPHADIINILADHLAFVERWAGSEIKPIWCVIGSEQQLRNALKGISLLDFEGNGLQVIIQEECKNGLVHWTQDDLSI